MKNPLINLFKYTFRYAGEEKWRVYLFMGIQTIAQLIGLTLPWIVSRIFNNVQFSSHDPRLLKFVLINLGFLLGASLLREIFFAVARIIERRFHFKIRKNYKQSMFEKVLALPAAWHKDHHSGNTIDKINTAGQSLYMFSGRIFFVIQISVMLVGSIVAVMFFDWRASIIALGMALVIFTFMFGVDQWLQKRYKKLYTFENYFASAIHDYITNITTIITLKLKKRVIKEIDRRGLAGYPTHHKVELVDQVKWFVIGFSITVMTAVALGVNALFSFKTEGVIVMGTLFALYGYLQNVGQAFFNIAFNYGEIVRQNAAVENAESIEDAYRATEHVTDRTLPLSWQNILIRDLNFTYDDSVTKGNEEQKTGIKHLKNISLDIKRGQRIAFIGESGSGKSTLLSVLRGLYEPRSVSVRVDGQEMPYGLRHLYQHITLVPQEPEIFNSTIEDNITMEVEVAPDVVGQAIEMAQFTSVLERLPRGLETNVLEKGVSLSGGEKQRLALARGILAAHDSDLLFLDEPTSSVDAINERQIYDNVFSEFSDKTIISTIHRLHLLEKFDTIYQFENGELIASGSLAQMMATPTFKVLWDKYMSREDSEDNV